MRVPYSLLNEFITQVHKQITNGTTHYGKEPTTGRCQRVSRVTTRTLRYHGWPAYTVDGYFRLPESAGGTRYDHSWTVIPPGEMTSLGVIVDPTAPQFHVSKGEDVEYNPDEPGYIDSNTDPDKPLTRCWWTTDDWQSNHYDPGLPDINWNRLKNPIRADNRSGSKFTYDQFLVKPHPTRHRTYQYPTCFKHHNGKYQSYPTDDAFPKLEDLPGKTALNNWDAEAARIVSESKARSILADWQLIHSTVPIHIDIEYQLETSGYLITTWTDDTRPQVTNATGLLVNPQQTASKRDTARVLTELTAAIERDLSQHSFNSIEEHLIEVFTSEAFLDGSYYPTANRSQATFELYR